MCFYRIILAVDEAKVGKQEAIRIIQVKETEEARTKAAREA